MEKISIKCPCCHASITVDSKSGAIISYEEREKKLSSFEDLKSDLDKKKELREQLFAQEQQTQKDRKRILEEKFQEAVKKADTESDEPFKNPLDYD
ncbi:MAG: 2-nitropropane dioxygenase [Pyrinomonadaceae bacterium]|nr:2-nitropropane dioxygenase [Pyrinomonadaceae bacterium]